MTAAKLIIVTGMSGVGKSTTAQNLARLYEQNNMPYTWYHEEIKDHPIRWADGGEFKAGSLLTEEGMMLNISDIYERWSSLINRITASGDIHVMEGCLFENINRYFFEGNYPEEKIIAYYDNLIKILEPADLHIIFLYRPNVKANLQRAFAVRGDKWKNLILNPEGCAYFDTRKYVGDESIFSMYEDYQNLAHSIFNRSKASKIKINTSDEQWDTYLKKITEFLNIKYYRKEEIKISSLEKYCGCFSNGLNGKYAFEVICENDMLYCSPPWFKYIKMNPLGNDEFELSSFPMKFKYDFKDGQRFINVSGNYDWGIVGKTLSEYWDE